MFAALLLPAGVIADKHGRKYVFQSGVACFGLASLACGLASSAETLILARAFQGVGAAFLIAPALAIIGHRFQVEKERAHAWAVWGTVMGLTMVLAPIIGGLIGSAFGWRWAFYANVPICAALLCVVPALVDESCDPHPRSLDIPGMALFVIAMLLITVGLILGPRSGWTSTRVLSSWLTGLAVFAGFVRVEKSRAHPMLDLSLFGRKPFIGAVTAMFAYAASAQVMASLLPLYLQGANGRGPVMAGVAMLPFASAMLIFPRIGRSLGKIWPSYGVLTLGLLGVGVGNALMCFASRNDGDITTMLAMAVLGAGGGLLNGETQKAVMVAVPPERAGMASGISTTSRFTGILLGFSGLGALLASRTHAVIEQDVSLRELSRVPLSSDQIDRVVAGDTGWSAMTLVPHDLSGAVLRLQHDYAQAFSTVFLVASAVAFIASLIVLTAMRDRRPSTKGAK
jgi:MFS family permease